MLLDIMGYLDISVTKDYYHVIYCTFVTVMVNHISYCMFKKL